MAAVAGRRGSKRSVLVVLALAGGLLASGTLAEGTVTPGPNGLIVVNSGLNLTLIDPVTGSRTTIPNSVSTDANPAWNPTGNAIAFDNSAGSIFTTTTNGIRQTILAGTGYRDPEFSPNGAGGNSAFANGSTLVFDGCGAPGGICTTSVTGGPVVGVNGVPAGAGCAGAGAQVCEPDFSPDGRFVVFDDGVGIARVNADGTGGYTTLTGTIAADESPRVSPDGTKVFFERGGAGIFWVPFPGGGAASQVFGTVAGDIDVAPSPDGTQLAYDGGPGIQRVPSGGGAATGVGGPAAGDITPSWGKTASPNATPTPVVGTPTPTPVPPTGTISGTVFKVSRSGRTRGLRRGIVSAGAASAITDRSGAYAISNVPGGTTVTAAARRKTCHADSVAGPLAVTTTGGSQTIDWFCVR